MCPSSGQFVLNDNSVTTAKVTQVGSTSVCGLLRSIAENFSRSLPLNTSSQCETFCTPDISRAEILASSRADWAMEPWITEERT